MYWANFLHFYQPFDQQKDILEMVVNQSYRPILRGIKSNPKARITLNVSGALTELFVRYNYNDLVEDLKYLGERGQLEFTSSAKYHTFLPLVSKNEIIRQIKANDKTNRSILGESYQPKGFFPPEMGYARIVSEVVEEMGYKWLLIDEIAYDGHVEQVKYDRLYKIKNRNLKVFFRERRVSNMIMGSIVRSDETLCEALQDDLKSNRYLLTGMDGETFGHHRPGLEKLLLEMYQSSKYQLVHISELEKYFQKIEEVEPIESTWASSPEDIKRKVQFLSWLDPENKIHLWQKDFSDWVLKRVREIDPKASNYEELMDNMDIALASDHFWWASAKPWWSLEMIEVGAYRLLNIVKNLPDVTVEEKRRAQDYYQNIVSTACEWQRSGKIREMAQEQKAILRIPLKERIEPQGFENVIKLMQEQIEKAVLSQEFEKAILWRDAIVKLREKNDIYDLVHAVDLLRVEVPGDKMQELVDQYNIDYQKIRGGQPEQRGA